ncbi:MmgE/PrpD family protein [Bradyrhizobium embrapense]|uniref:MmgE/PrpD family protein n=1 Tax=Bradyrhizobium embrapense TaxID=630921 RepID=UPI0009FD5C87|nr:MmgE/PrpD family protein [Bradyrhizobium embrapense]
MSNLSLSLTTTLARYFSSLMLEDVPVDVRAEARRLFLDWIGCAIAGSRTSIAPKVSGLVDFFGAGNTTSIVGRPQKGSLVGALYANARLANCMDLDDTFPVAHHFGCGAVASALALAETREATGAKFLQALIAAYELGGRVATALGQIARFKDGRITGYPSFYSLSAPLVFAAAGAAIQLFSQDEKRACETFGIAGSNTPLPAAMKWASSLDLPDCKYADAGWTAITGVFAAQSAQLGATGFADIFDGNHSVIRMSGTDSFNPDHLIGELGSRWMLRDVCYKPWPTCGWTHQPLTALVKALGKTRVKIEHIERIVILTNEFTSTARFQNPAPRTFCSRQFSIPHAVAMMLLGVPVGSAWLDEAQDGNMDVKAIREKVHVENWDHANTWGQHLVREQTRNMPARATVFMRDGTKVEADADFAFGNPWLPDTAWGDEQVIRKFRIASELPEREADTIIDAIMDIEKASNVEPIVSILRAI